MEYFKQLVDDINKNKTNFWIGVVEDVSDPLTLGRVKVRVYKIHPEDKTLVPTSSLPWAIVLQPGNSASASGVGWSPNGLIPGSQVFGIFLDGELGQYPLVFGSIPQVHRPNAPTTYGGTGSGYLDNKTPGSYSNTPPYHGQGSENGSSYTGTALPNTVGGGNNIRDDGTYLTDANKPNWPLKLYTYKPSYDDNGLACKDNTLRIHYSTALALEELTNQFGKGTLRIKSAYRSPSYNAGLSGAAKNSQHIQGRAFDISLASIGGQSEIAKFGQLAVKNGFCGFGIYSTFIHIDTGPGRVWNGATASWFVDAITKAGWYQGKPGLQGVKVDPSNTATSTSSANTASSSSSANTITSDSTVYDSNSKVVGVATAYGPGTGGTEGGIESAYKGPDGTNIVRTLEDYRTGRSSYVTIAGNPTYRGNQYTIPTISYKYNGQTYTLNNVPCVVNDTGGAFKNAPEGRFDIPVAAYMSSAELNSQPFSGQNIGFLKGATVAKNGNSVPGFTDPTNSYPYNSYRGTPSTNEAARGFNGNPHINYTKNTTGGMTGFPAAGNKGTFGEPSSGFAPQYPHNHVYSTKSGHMIEMDDSPGAERVNIFHKSGSKFEITAKGSTILKTLGNAYVLDAQDAFHGVQGEYHLTSVGDMNIRTTSDLIIQSDGSKVEMCYGEQFTTVSGRFDILVGDVLSVKANKILIEGNDIDIYSKGNLSIQTEGDLNMKGKTITIEGTNSMDLKSKTAKMTGSDGVQIKGSTVYMDDIIRMAEGGASDAKSAKDAQSTDLGTAMSRKKIQKNAAPKEHPDSHITTEEALDIYST